MSGWTIYDSKGRPLVSSDPHDHDGVDASGKLTNDWHDGYSLYDEIAAPGAPAANKLRLYAFDGPSTAAGGAATVPAFVSSAGVIKILDSGVYTPTLTNGANVAASTAFECQWMRIGAIVTVGGRFACDPTAANTQTFLGISLPIASNLGAEEDCMGTCGCRTVSGAGAVFGVIASDIAQAQFWPTSDVNAAWGFTFVYTII